MTTQQLQQIVIQTISDLLTPTPLPQMEQEQPQVMPEGMPGMPPQEMMEPPANMPPQGMGLSMEQ